ncbi:hypothetical protein RV18_GL001609 [Enterococcus termitis]|nr:hypothetical protein RV18_GL001609 [Enterococcus termitis]
MLATGTLAQLLPAIYFIADKDDAPGLILIFFIPLCLAALLAFTSNKALSQIKTTRNHF